MFSIPLRLITRRFQTPNYSFSVFDRIFKKTQTQQQTTNKNNQQQTHKQQSKKKTQGDEEEDEYDLFNRQKQTLRNVDYVKLKQQSKILSQNIGKQTIEEIIFWADGIENPDQIMKLVDSFNKCWNDKSAQFASESFQFKQFCNKVIKFSYLAKDFESLNKIAQFALLYDISEQQIWNKIEQKLLNLLKTQLDIQLFCDITLKFVKVKQGEMIYYKLDDLAEANIQILSPSSISKILFIMFQRTTGDIKTLSKYLTTFVNKIDDAKPSDIVLLATFLSYIKMNEQDNRQVMQKIENKIVDDEILKKLTLLQISVVTKCFGNQMGTDKFWKLVQEELIKIKSLTKLQAEEILYGPLNSYRISSQAAKYLIDLVFQHLQSLKATHLSQLSKIMYIYQLDNQTNYQRIQGLIMQQLQDLSLSSLQQLMHVCKNYSITRHGSRDIYKLLQVVILARMQQIKLNRKIFIGIYNIYNKSDLCSVEMIKEFGKFR